MTSHTSPYFRRELAVATAAQAVLSVREEIIRLQRIREANREMLSAAKRRRLSHQHRFWECISQQSGPHHPAGFIESGEDSVITYTTLEQQRIEKELKALERQRKEHLSRLLDLKPETSTMPKGDLNFLLQPSGIESDDDDADSERS